MWIGILLLLMYVSLAQAVVRTVDKDGGQDHMSIQEAVTASSAGDEIRIFAGATAYNECVNSASNGTLANPIRLTAASGQAVIITPTCNAGTEEAAIQITHNYWVIDGTVNGGTLTFDGGAGNTPYWAVVAEENGSSITNITVQNTTCANWALNTTYNQGRSPGCFHSYGDSATARTVTNFIVRNNTITNYRGFGVNLGRCVDCLVEQNTINTMRCNRRSNGATHAIGIRLEGTGASGGEEGQRAILRNNTIHDSTTTATCVADVTPPGGHVIAGVYCDTGPEFAEIIQNYIYNIGQGSAANEYRGLFIEARCDDFTIRNNVLRDVGGTAIVSGNATNNTQRLTVRHNTLARTGDRCFRVRNGVAYVAQSNICNDATTAIREEFLAFQDRPHTINYNNYRTVTNWQTQPTSTTTNTHTTLAAWQGATPFDDNSHTSSSGFNNGAGNDFTLTAGAATLAAGHDGLDMGAFTGAPSILNCEIGAVSTTTLVINWTVPQFGGVFAIDNTRLDVEYDTIDQAENSSVVQSLTQTRTTMNAAPGGSAAVVVKTTHGAVTTTEGIGAASSILRGASRANSTGVTCTNNVTGGPPAVGTLDQTLFRFRRYGITGEAFTAASTVRNGVENGIVSFPPGARGLVRIQLECNGGDPCTTISPIFYACDGTCGTPSNWYVVGATFDGALLRRVNDPTITSNAPTTAQLTSCGTFVAGAHIDGDSSVFPTLALASGACTEGVLVFEINPLAVASSDTVLIGFQHADGTDLDSTVNAQITVVLPFAQR
jgi:hypothetical protein